MPRRRRVSEQSRRDFGGTLENKTALVLCGKGNNGGDGAAIARGLSRLGVHCDVILFGKLADSIGDARINLEAVHQLAALKLDHLLHQRH